MTAFVSYDPDSGEIRTWGDVQDPLFHVQYGEVLLGRGANPTHHVLNGTLVAYTAGEAAEKAAVPTYPATWSNSTFMWVDGRQLAQAKVDQWEALKNSRSSAILAGFSWDGSRFDADEVSQQRIGNAVTLAMLAASAGQPYSIEWTLFDNTTRVLSGPDLIAVGQALGAFMSSVFSTGIVLRERVNAANTLDEVKQVNWPAT